MSHYTVHSSNRKGPTIESLHHRVDNWSSDCPVDLVRCRRLSKHMVYIGSVVKTFFTPVSVPLTELEARVARCGRYDGILSLYRPFQSTLLPVGKKCHEREREKLKVTFLQRLPVQKWTDSYTDTNAIHHDEDLSSLSLSLSLAPHSSNYVSARTKSTNHI